MTEKAYESTRVVVHAAHLLGNLKTLSEYTGPGVMKMAVVKADAYGHGAVQVSRIIGGAVDWLAVVSVEEGIELREAGIDKPILVFGVPKPHTALAYRRYELTASVSQLGHLDLLPEGTSVHLDFDTGMGRLGFMPEQAGEVLAAMEKARHLKVEGIMSHFATADEPGSPLAARQLEVFRSLRAQFPGHLVTHMANSGGILHLKESHFDMVRHGISMYGYPPGLPGTGGFRPALTWEAGVVQCRPVRRGETVSYGAKWAAGDDGYLITVPVGYADGVPRLLSGKFNVILDGEPVQQVGTVTMDYIMLYSGKPVGSDHPTALLFDSHTCHAGIWASTLGTIPYEILCGISSKIKRIVV